VLIAVVAAAALVVLLALAPAAALGSAGGGSAGFGGGDGGGGGGFSGVGHGGGAGKAFALYFIFRALFDIARLGHGLGALVLVALLVAWYLTRRGVPRMAAFWEARSQQGHARRRQTRKRERRVELAAAEAADEDPMFGPEHVRAAADALFTEIQFAWDAQDRLALRRLVAPRLLDEWERRLDELQARGWRNRVQLVGPPNVEFVGIRRGADDRVVVRIEAKLRDYVVDSNGRHIKRAGQFTETVRLREYWTLERRDDHWILASIEQGAEGEHALSDVVAPTAWSDEQRLRDEAILESAAAETVPAGTDLADLTNVQFSDDARATAIDLSLADGRFAPDVLEVAARRAVAAWAEAVDGSDASLSKIADPAAVRDLLHPGDPSERTRLVVRGPQVKRIAVVALDPTADPSTMTIDVEVEGRRYLEDRDTTRVLAGNANRATRFTERWRLALTGEPSQPWRIASVQTPTPTA
jgi:predicted lipid-binding transport protein (Tim44 family)